MHTMVVSRGPGERGRDSCLKRMNKFGDQVHNDAHIMNRVHVKMVTVVNFMFCVFYHN